MKKYKLIKEYPGSPKLGTEVEYNTYNSSYKQITTNGFTHIMRQLVENQPEYWELVVEKEYEILSYKNSQNSILLNYKEVYDLDFFKKGNWEINSVKRLSDGEVFTIGDTLTTGIIQGIYFLKPELGNTICFGVSKDDEDTDIRDATKAKQKLFTTEDGVNIFKGDKYYTIALDKSDSKYPWSIVGPYINPKALEPSGDILYFSTKKAAEEYIVMNKPCLSLKEVLNTPYSQTFTNKEYLKNLVKSRL